MSDAASKVYKIQACCAGYQGNSATVYGALDSVTDILVVAKISTQFQPERFQDSRLIANCKVPSWDSMFSDENLDEAIDEYVIRTGDNRIMFKPEAQRAKPQSGLQLLKVTEAGRRYEISPSITNEQMAVLMLCWHLKVVTAIKTAFEFGDMLESLNRSGMWTV